MDGRYFAHGKQLVVGNLCVAVALVADFQTEASAKKAATAFNAFDVMIRTGWGVEQDHLPNGNEVWIVRPAAATEGWYPDSFAAWYDQHGGPDPFTALVEADKWYKANVEDKR